MSTAIVTSKELKTERGTHKKGETTAYCCLLVDLIKLEIKFTLFSTVLNAQLLGTGFIGNKTLCGRRCVRRIGMYISCESAYTSVQGLMIGSTEYSDSPVCR